MLSKIDISLINMVSALRRRRWRWQWTREWDSAIIWHPFSVSAFGGIPKREEKWAFYLHYKYKYANIQIKKWSFCIRICVLGQKNHLFCKKNTQMHHFKVEPLQCNVWPSFAYLCVCVLEQKNHSLISRLEWLKPVKLFRCTGFQEMNS